MNSGYSHRRGCYLDTRADQLLDGAECTAAKFLGHSIGAGRTFINYADEFDRSKLTSKLMVNARVIAAEATDSDYRDRNRILGWQFLILD